MNKKLLLSALCMASLSSFAQNITIRGKVVNERSEPLPYAIVYIKGTYAAQTTDTEGNFSFTNQKTDSLCLVSNVTGYIPKELCLRLTGKDTTVQMDMVSAPYLQQEVIVNSTRADQYSAMTFTTINKEQIAKQNFGQDVPLLLQSQPSVVTTSDAGAGIGYSGIRIRGSDGTRINVTINGIPVNDAESHSTFWVNLPDVVSSVENIQVQRGAGTSTNGAGSFGGSINLQTELNRPTAYSELTTSAGSFNTYRFTAKAGTGLINNRWSFDTRLSRIGSDGFIDRGRSDLSSWYMSGGYYGDRLSVKAITFSGKERTYQCWYGVPEDSVKSGNITYNPAGEYTDTSGALAYYDGQVDDYKQDYYQLHLIFNASENWTVNTALHATKGRGFYEEYKPGEALSDYISTDTSGQYTDLVRRRWLDNWFYGATWAVHYNSYRKLSAIIGGAANQYDGAHFGEVIWATTLPAGSSPGLEYYRDDAMKRDVNGFTKITWHQNRYITLFGDLQARYVFYSFQGPDINGNILPQEQSYTFINPRAGITWRPHTQHTVYFSVSGANKEPNRDDFVNSTPNSRPKHETLYDVEAGWKSSTNKYMAEVSLFYMYYINQLVLTGKVNDVGAYTRENVKSSYRAGIEITGAYKLTDQITAEGNIAFSDNRIRNYVQYIDDYDNGVQIADTFSNPTIAFSPSVISAFSLSWEHRSGISISMNGKYVSRQYLDNTATLSRSLDPFFLAGSVIRYSPEKLQNGKHLKGITLSLQVNNLFNTLYAPNGYTFGFVAGGETQYYNYYYPQAGINWMGMLSIRF